jgi:hypothetical protein
MAQDACGDLEIKRKIKKDIKTIKDFHTTNLQ